LYRRIELDTWTGLEASDACKDFTDEKNVFNTGGDPWAARWLETGAGKDWLEAHGLPRNGAIAPDRQCAAGDSHPTIEFHGVNDGDTITKNQVEVSAVINATDGIKTWSLEYGIGNNPGEWSQIAAGQNVVDRPTPLLNWDVSNIGSNTVSLRLFVTGEKGYAERKITLSLNLPTPTPTPTLSPTVTLPAPTDTATPSPTLPVPTETVTPFPSATPTPTP
jgi:hypothetical protein